MQLLQSKSLSLTVDFPLPLGPTSKAELLSPKSLHFSINSCSSLSSKQTHNCILLFFSLVQEILYYDLDGNGLVPFILFMAWVHKLHCCIQLTRSTRQNGLYLSFCSCPLLPNFAVLSYACMRERFYAWYNFQFLYNIYNIYLMQQICA